MSDEQTLRDAIRVLRIELRIVNDKVARAAGLNPRDLDILDVIDRDGPCSPSHLAERTGYHRATLTGILSRLEHENWLIRDSDPDDGRSSRVRPSPRFDELRRLYEPIDTPTGELAAGLSPDDREQLVRVLGDVSRITRTAGDNVGAGPVS